MNVYDFDNTILRGDSTKRFYAFCLRRHPRMILRWPGLCLSFIAWKSGRMDKTGFKTRMFRFLSDIGDVQAEVAAFWRQNESRLYPWYLSQKRPDDLIISASPLFLVAPVCERLGVRLIASLVDPDTGRFTGPNCYGEEKVIRYRREYGDVPIDDFYSDSRSDEPLSRLSRRSFLVRRGVPGPWK